MADNILVSPGAGATIAADDIGGVLHQRIKVVIGADGVSGGDVSSANPMPVNSPSNVTEASTGNATLNFASRVDIPAPTAYTNGQARPLSLNKLGKLRVDTDMTEQYPLTALVVAADVASITTIGANSQELYTGSATAGSTANLSYTNLTYRPAFAKVQISGTWVATLSIEGTMDNGTTFFKVPLVQDNGSLIFTTTSNAVGNVNTAGLTGLRVRGVSYTSGTIQVNAAFSNFQSSVFVANQVSTNLLALDSTQTNGTQKTKLLDSSGVALDSLNSGAGLNALNIAFSGTNYIVSTNNSTSAQLASNATFTGLIDNTFNQQALTILITSDQPGVLTLKQYSDSIGTRKVPDMVFTHPSGGLSRSVTLNGNFTNITYKNTGFATTTILRVDSAFGIIPATTSLGNSQTSLDEINGTAITPRPDGWLRVSPDPTGLLYDTFESLDTINTWVVGGTVSPTGSAGNLSVGPGTAANASSFAKSIPTFLPSSSSYLQMADLIQIEAGVVTGNQRFWGLGVYVTPTTTVPVTNGSIFEIDSATGNLLASTYSNSIRTNSVQITRPADGLFHRYAIYYKASRVYFEVDNVQVASIQFPNPQVATLSTVIGSVNGAAVVASAPVLNATVIGLAETAKNSFKMSDGTFAWRTAKVNPDGSQISATVDGFKATYSAAVVGLVPGATPQDIFTLTGSATRTIRINRVTVTATQTTASQVNVLLLRRSTANTAGTSTALTSVSHDSTNTAATATGLAYTVNPTAGTLVGNIRARKVFVGTTTGNSDEMSSDFGTRNDQAIVLRGTSQVFAVNLNGIAVAGGSFNIIVEWTEET